MRESPENICAYIKMIYTEDGSLHCAPAFTTHYGCLINSLFSAKQKDKVKMLFLSVIFITVMAVASQHVHPEHLVHEYPEWYVGGQPSLRERRDVTLDHQIGNGKVFGTLGQNDNGLFGKAGYDRQIFNDERGKLNGQVYGSRVLGPFGDSSHLGGGLRWENPNAAASLDVSRQIHGPTSIQGAAGGRWPVGKNGDFSLQGTYGHTSGMKPEYGGLGNFRYRW